MLITVQYKSKRITASPYINRVCQHIVFVLMLLFSGNVFSTTIIEVPYSQIIQQASLIIEGDVIAITNIVETGLHPKTQITLRVLDLIKGDYAAKQIKLNFLGGFKNGRTLKVSGMLIPDIGEHGVYFISDPNQDAVHPLVGWHQGHFLIQQSSSSADAIVMPRLSSNHQASANRLAPTSLNQFKAFIQQSLEFN